MTDTLDLLEQRVKTLELLVGQSSKIDDTKAYETIVNLYNKLSNYINENSKISNFVKNSNEIQRYSEFNFLDEIDDENLLKAKMELILEEETYIRRVNRDFENFQALSKILDDKNFNDIPRLTELLRDLSAKHLDCKQSEQAYTLKLKQFLAEYFTTIQSISETMENLNSFLVD